MCVVVGRDSSVGIATGYGLGGPGIKSRWGRDFSHTSRPALGSTQPPVKWVPGPPLSLRVCYGVPLPFNYGAWGSVVVKALRY
jgi:hypothetical protein